MTGQNKFFPFTIDSAIVLTVVSAFGYLCPFVYEYRYCSKFEIPTSLISIGLPTLISFWAGTFLALLILFYFIVVGKMTTSWFKNPSNKLIFIWNLIFFITIALSIFAVGHFDTSWWIYLGSLVIVNVIIFIRVKSKKSIALFDIPILSTEGVDGQPARLTANERQVNLKRVYLIFTTMLMGFILFISAAKGSGDAENDISFLVLSSDPSVVIIKIYGDQLICKKLIDNEISSKLIILKINDSTPIELERKNIGPLVGPYALN